MELNCARVKRLFELNLNRLLQIMRSI